MNFIYIPLENIHNELNKINKSDITQTVFEFINYLLNRLLPSKINYINDKIIMIWLNEDKKLQLELTPFRDRLHLSIISKGIIETSILLSNKDEFIKYFINFYNKSELVINNKRVKAIDLPKL